MFKVQGMIACLLALLLCLLVSCARAEAVVGKDVAIEDITDFYYTYETPYAVSVYQRYGNAEIMFGVENGRLIYLRTDASPFPRAKVPDRATFTRLGGGM